jgi:alcohol dehydrogenase class IV
VNGSAITFQVPPTLVVGAGASRGVGDHARRLGVRRVLLVTDPWLAESGLAGAASDQLAASSVAVTVFAGVQPDPTDANVLDGLAAYHESECDAVVGLGGGSVLDAAKMIAVLTANDGHVADFMGYHRIPDAGAPLVAIPTTAGTGSEATRVAVITDTANDVKMMILDSHLVPAVALVDHELSASMPPALTAHVGIDTLTHGIEAYVSRLAGPMTDPYALSCVRLTAANLETAWREPRNAEARAAMALAACQGGIAFSNSSVALVHGMSRPVGALFHIAHGLSNAVLLPTVTRFSVPGAPERYSAVARAMGLASHDDPDEAAAAALADALDALSGRLEIPRLRDVVGVGAAAFEASLAKMAADALASGSPDRNPIVPTGAEIEALYREAW